MTEIDIDHLRQWIGKSEEREELLSADRAVSLAAALDHEKRPVTGEALPPLWHWAYFLPTARQSELGVDGHPKLGGFMPPVPLPRRMWVGGRLEFLQPARLGDMATRRTEIIDVTSKKGKNGALVFVTLRHEISVDGTCCITEEQDLVYRQAEPAPSVSSTPKAERAPDGMQTAIEEIAADWRERFTPNPVLLFRYSAVTFNAHRIHYDQRYAREEENYPGLVVHGPLGATLLVDRLSRHTGSDLGEFRFRAARPLFCDQEMRICGKQTDEKTYDVWTETPGGLPSMTATAVVR